MGKINLEIIDHRRGIHREKGQRSKNWQQSWTLSKREQALTKDTAD